MARAYCRQPLPQARRIEKISTAIPSFLKLTSIVIAHPLPMPDERAAQA
jgi:hypothetical protein